MSFLISAPVAIYPIIVFALLAIIYTLYKKWSSEKNKRHVLEDKENHRKLYSFAETYKKENPKSSGHFLALCRFDGDISDMLFVKDDQKVSDVLKEKDLLEDAKTHDWYVADGNGYHTEFYLLNEGFDWYLQKDECWYYVPGAPKNRKKKVLE